MLADNGAITVIDYKDLFSFCTFLLTVVAVAMNLGKLAQRVSVLEARALEDRGDMKAIKDSLARLESLLTNRVTVLEQQVAVLHSQERSH